MESIKVTPYSATIRQKSNSLPRRVSTIFPQRSITSLKPKLIRNSLLNLLISIIIVFIALFENNRYSQAIIKVDLFNLYLRIGIISLSLVQFCLLAHYWSLRVKINEAYFISYSKSGIFAGNNCKKLIIFEFSLVFIIQPYGFNEIIYESATSLVTLDDMITVLILSRSYFLIKFLYDSSYFNSNRAQWIA